MVVYITMGGGGGGGGGRASSVRLNILASGDPLPQRARGERVWGHRYTKSVFYHSKLKGRFKGHEYLVARPCSSKDETAGASHGLEQLLWSQLSCS